jgi:hypothetical protein
MEDMWLLAIASMAGVVFVSQGTTLARFPCKRTGNKEIEHQYFQSLLFSLLFL